MQKFFTFTHLRDSLLSDQPSTQQAVLKSAVTQGLSNMGYVINVENAPPLVTASHQELLDLVSEYLEESMSGLSAKRKVDLVEVAPYYYKATFF